MLNLRSISKVIVQYTFFVFLLSFISVNAGTVPWANGQSRAEDLQIKLVTFGVGDDIPSYWGHTALIVEDTRLQKSKIYNYGLFSFGDGMILNFLMGRLIFSGGAFSVPAYLNYYRNMNREIRVATLKLPDRKKVELAAALANSVLPENRDYLYHHYDENCATRLRDYLDKTLDGELKRATLKKARMSLRDHSRRYMARSPLLELGHMFLTNKEVDRPIQVWNEMFLPDELERQVLDLKITDSTGNAQSIVSDYIILFKPDRDEVPAEVPPLWPKMLLSGLFIAGLACLFAFFAVKNPLGWAGTLFGAWQALIGLGLGLPGLILFLISVFTEHTVSYWNINLAFAHPLYLILIVYGTSFAYGKIKSITKIYRFWVMQVGLTILGLLLNFLPFFGQDNRMLLALLLPIIIGYAGATLFFKTRFKRVADKN